MNINNALNKIKNYDNLTSKLIWSIDKDNFEREIISKTADFIKDNFNVKNIYVCYKNDSFIILKNSECNPIFKINFNTVKKENLPFTINKIPHPLEEKHECPLSSNDGIPSICLPVKKSMHNEDYEGYLHIQFEKYPDLKEEESVILSHIALTLQKAYQYYIKFFQLKENANSISEEYKQFIHFVSHDLKSPVTAILGFIAIINDEGINIYSEDLKHYIDRISKNARIIDKMISDISYISRLEKADVEEINTNELIAELIVPLQPSIKQKNIKLRIGEGIPKIFANRSHISKLFQLILKNSIEFTDTDGEISIGYKDGEFYIADTGIGIKNNNLEKVFRIFYTTCYKKEEHIGTGLYIAKKIVALYGGSIRIESEYGRGTTVYFTLPLKK